MSVATPIYLDYAATTPVDPRVAKKMANFLTCEGIFGNASSLHTHGQMAKAAIEQARVQVAALINADPQEIIWTSGATEANNLAIKGAAQLYQSKGKHIVTTKIEHPSVLDCCQQLEKNGFSITYLTPQKNGLIDVKTLEAALRHDTILVSIMQVNNETGVIQPIDEISRLTSARGILFHVDGVQSAGKIKIDVDKTSVDLMTFSAHKLYGPKGIGALYLRRKPRVRVAPQIVGGGQERGMRSGTLATHQIIGMGEAFHFAKMEFETDHKKLSSLGKRFLQEIDAIKSIKVNGDRTYSVPNIINLYFEGIKSKELFSLLPELAISAGSACHGKGEEPSHVLRAMGQNEEQASCAVRFSLGRFTTLEDINLTIHKIKEIYQRRS